MNLTVSQILILAMLLRADVVSASGVGFEATLSDPLYPLEKTCEDLLPAHFPPDWGLNEDEIAAMGAVNPLIRRYLYVLSQVIDLVENTPDAFFSSLGAYMSVPVGPDFPDAIESYKGLPWSEIKRYLPKQIDDPDYHKRSVQLLNAMEFWKPRPRELATCFQQLDYLNVHLVFLDLLFRIQDPPARALPNLIDCEAHIKRFIARRGIARLAPKNLFLHAKGAISLAARLVGGEFRLQVHQLGIVMDTFEASLRGEPSVSLRDPRTQKALTALQRMIRNSSPTDQTRLAKVLLGYTRTLLQQMSEQARTCGVKSDELMSTVLNDSMPSDPDWRSHMLSLICELHSGGVSYSSAHLRTQLKSQLREMIKEFKIKHQVHKKPMPQSATTSLFFSPAVENLSSIFKPEVQQGPNYRIARPEKPPRDSDEKPVEEIYLLNSVDDLQADLRYDVLFDRIFHSQQVSFSPEIVLLLKQDKQGPGPRWIEAIQAGPAREKGQKGIKRIEPPFFG